MPLRPLQALAPQDIFLREFKTGIQVNVPLGLLTSAALVALRPGTVVVDEERLLWRLCFKSCSPRSVHLLLTLLCTVSHD